MPSPHQIPDDESDARRTEFDKGEHEVQLKVAEIELKHSQAEKDSRLTPILIAVWTAAVAALGNGAVSWFNGQQTYRLESEKAQSAIILEVVKTNGPDRAATSLGLLLQIGVISQEYAGEKLQSYLKTRAAGQGPSKDGVSSDPASEANCKPTGDYVVVDVHWGDADGGLNVRVGPNQTQVGVIPATGTGIDVGACTGGWCQVHYRCLSGWAFAQHLKLRSTRLANVKGVSDSTGLIVRRDPDRATGVQTGTLASAAKDIVKHSCQTGQPMNDEQWCQISAGTISGWVPQENLADEPMPQTPSVVSNARSEVIAPANPTPTGSAPPRPE
jgi:uncharacterized protein YraI